MCCFKGLKDNIENICEHKNKIYSTSGQVLLSFPSKTCTYWVCKDCGYKGCDIRENEAERALFEQQLKYDETCKKFNKMEE